MTDESTDFDEIARQQQLLNELSTRRDIWLTAAVMTAVLTPFGTPFGLLALLLARGSRAAIERKDFAGAGSRIDRCRLFALIGTVIGLVVLLLAAATMIGTLFQFRRQM